MELYIDGTRVPTFGENGVDIVDTIQNVKDIKRIFTAFSQQFTIPATKEVNRIFRHYYNFNVQNGFDARFKIDGAIKIRGVDFRTGKIRLNGTVMKDGLPHSYKIVFFGDTVELADLLGEDELSSLNLDQYNHTYNLATVKTGFQTGLGVNGASSTNREVIYPFISHTNQFQYDGTGFHQFGNSTKLSYIDLKPAIAVSVLLDAIETRYGLTFDSDFFAQDEIEKLYLWLHREKGVVTSGNETQNWTIDSDDWTLNTGSELRPIVSQMVDIGTIDQVGAWYDHKVTITPISTSLSGLYDVKMTDVITGEVVGEWTNQSGTTTFTSNSLTSTYARYWRIKTEISTAGQLNTFSADMTLVKYESFYEETPYGDDWYLSEESQESTYDSPNATESMVGEIIISQQMPKMKVIDFLTGIFKLFNLTAYGKQGNITVKPLDTYYDEGNTYDVTKYIDFGEKVNVDRVLPFRAVKFAFMPPKTFLAIKRNELTNQEFGSLEYTGGDSFDGTKYDIKVPFEKMMFERIQNEANSTVSDICYGWFVDGKGDSTLGSPLLFYNRQEYNTAQSIVWTDSSSTTQYNCPSNSLAGDVQSLNFNAEIDEVDLTLKENSLFQVGYNRYISNLYNIQARKSTFTAYLPQWLILNYQLNDIFVINNREYRINSVRVNPVTGKAKLELINRLDTINTEEQATQSIPSQDETIVSSILANSITVTWTDVPSSRIVGYNAYENGVFKTQVSTGVESHIFGGLLSSKSYELWILPVTADGDEALLSDSRTVVNATTLPLP